MNKTILFYSTFFLLSISFLISSNYIDILELNNGSTIKGKIIENKINQYVRIELSGGSIFQFKYNEIETIKSELIKVEAIEESPSQSFSIKENVKSLLVEEKKNSTNCYLDGLEQGKNQSSVGNFAGSLVGGYALGIIGWGISYAIVSGSNPSVPTELMLRYDNCDGSYIRGYKESVKANKKTSTHIGSVIGWLIFLATYDDY